MRIVNRKTFLALPAGTLFAKWAKQPKDGSYDAISAEDMGIKGETCGENDFCRRIGIVPRLGDGRGGDEQITIILAMMHNETAATARYDIESRDGLFDEDQLFLVWDADDHRRLIERLLTALFDAHSTENSAGKMRY